MFGVLLPARLPDNKEAAFSDRKDKKGSRHGLGDFGYGLLLGLRSARGFED